VSAPADQGEVGAGPDDPVDVVVVGAGIAGLLAARALAAAGRSVVVLDKGRDMGGRLATRRIGAGVFDHGAQFFTVREPDFAAMVAGWLAAGIVIEWSRGFPTPEGPRADGHPRYRVAGGMAALAQHLARGLDVRVAERVTRVEVAGARYAVVGESGRRAARSLLLTPPVPQSLELLRAGGVELEGSARVALERIAYAPCLAALALLEGPSAVPPPGALVAPAGPIEWLADNQRKGLSPGAAAITIHATAAFSRAAFDDADAAIADALLAAAAPWLGARVAAVEVKRWRYAAPTVLHPERCLVTTTPGGQLAFAGDAFGGPRVEGAALSGLAAARRLVELVGEGS
jgi:renalase